MNRNNSKVQQILNATIVTGKYKDSNGEQKTNYLIVGTLFIYNSGGMSLKLDALPANGQDIQFYPRKQKNQQPQQQQNNNYQQPQQQQNNNYQQSQQQQNNNYQQSQQQQQNNNYQQSQQQQQQNNNYQQSQQQQQNNNNRGY